MMADKKPPAKTTTKKPAAASKASAAKTAAKTPAKAPANAAVADAQKNAAVKTAYGKAVISAQKVLVGYEGRVVLDHVSLDVNKGELFGLIGLNGVGKTSLIKVMLNLRVAQGGQVFLNDNDCLTTKARQDVAYLPERFDPPLFMTGHEFIRFSAGLYGRTVKKEEAIRYAEMLDLSPDYLRRRANTYSKGMRQKLGLIATVLSGCQLLILDEPMSGLDPQARVRVKDLLMACHREGRTIFLSSHILADLDELCDRITVLHAKEFRYLGTPAGLRQEMGEPNLERAFLKLIAPYAQTEIV
jgi:ABC-2 type transport system ATP-binding protein